MESLIAHIAKRHISSEENLATEILVYILNRAGSDILRGMLTQYGVQLEPGSRLHLEPQRGDEESAGIPDIRVLDQTDHLCALIENKFDARFTGHQRNTYLSKLKGGGRLLFVLPERRMQKVLSELPKLFPDANDRGRLTVISWGKLLDGLQEAIVDPLRQQRLIPDVEQLRRYCKVADKQTFDPFTADQIEGEASSQMVHHLTWITQHFIKGCLENRLVDKWKAKKLSAKIEEDDASLNFGQDLHFCGAVIWMGLWVKMWREQREHCTTPLWIWLCDSNDADPNERSRAAEIAKLLADAGVYLNRVEEVEGWVIPICLRPGDQQEQGVQGAVAFVRRLHDLARRHDMFGAKSRGR